MLWTMLVAILMSSTRGTSSGSSEVCTGSGRCGWVGVVGVGTGTANRIRGDVAASLLSV